ncbi:MAG: hypothetical protein ACOCUV_03775 [bacterium]
MQLKVELAPDKNTPQTIYKACLLDGNIVLDDNTRLPGCDRNYIHFHAGYSPIYSRTQNGRNTRIRYPKTKNSLGENILYCKLYWLQRRKLDFIVKKSWFHKDPVAFIALLISVAAFIIALLK